MEKIYAGLQRSIAFFAAATLYVLPFALAGWSAGRELKLETSVAPVRIASFALSVPDADPAPEPVEVEAEEVSEPAASPVAVAEPVSADVKAVPKPESVQPPEEPSTEKELAQTGRGKEKAKSEKKKGARCMASSGQVKQLGTRRFEVRRSLLDHYFRNLDLAARIGSAAWQRDEEGDIVGIRVSRVRCGGPLEEAGLQRGDVIRSFNGRTVDALADAIALWWQLRRKDSLRVVIIRDGRRQRLRYDLV